MRYERQTAFYRIGEDGQKRLGSARVAVVGLGGLGSMVSQLLCRAGVGSLFLFDRDRVDLSNLHRQLLYDEKDVGKSKPKTAAERLKRINSDVKITAYDSAFNSNAAKKMPDVDLIVDCTDNMDARFAINEYCVQHRLPWVHGAVRGENGMVINFIPGGPCFACIMPCTGGRQQESGIINTLPAFIGAIQANEAIKMILGRRESLMLCIDIWDNEVQKIKIKKRRHCSVCGK